MDANSAIELARAALILTLTVAGPLLFAALFTGLIIGLPSLSLMLPALMR